MKIVLLLLAVIALTDAHRHPSARRSRGNCTCVPGSRPAESYHIHVMFMRPDSPKANPKDPAANNPNNPTNAAALRASFIKHFGISDCAAGHAVDTEDRLCSFPVDATGGQPYPAAQPFVTPEFAFFVPLEKYAAAVGWMMLNRGVFDVLVHPNTCGWSCAPQDHLLSSLWMGTPWKVKFRLSDDDAAATVAASMAMAAKTGPAPTPSTTAEHCDDCMLKLFLFAMALFGCFGGVVFMLYREHAKVLATMVAQASGVEIMTEMSSAIQAEQDHLK